MQIDEIAVLVVVGAGFLAFLAASAFAVIKNKRQRDRTGDDEKYGRS